MGQQPRGFSARVVFARDSEQEGIDDVDVLVGDGDVRALGEIRFRIT